MNDMLIEEMTLKGVNSTTKTKLKEHGILTGKQLLPFTAKDLAELTGMGVDTADKTIRTALKELGTSFTTGDKALETQMNGEFISLGSSEFNRILGGGIRRGVITELYGAYGSGKTQTCFTLCVTAQQPVGKGGLGGEIAFIDSEGTAERGGLERIAQIAEARGYDSNEILKKIHFMRAVSSIHQDILITSLNQITQEHNICLVIVDSIISHLRQEYEGRGQLSPRQQKLGVMLGKLLRYGEGNNVAVVITNQVISDPTVIYGNPDKPTGGHVLGHSATYRVEFIKGRQNTRLVHVVDSSHLKDEKVRVAITEAGIVNEDGLWPQYEDEDGKETEED